MGKIQQQANLNVPVWYAIPELQPYEEKAAEKLATSICRCGPSLRATLSPPSQCAQMWAKLAGRLITAISTLSSAVVDGDPAVSAGAKLAEKILVETAPCRYVRPGELTRGAYD